MFRKLLAVLAITTAAPALAEQVVYPYLLTQGHNNTEQLVRKDIPVQVQLPAGPTKWALHPGESTNVRLTDTKTYASPDRIVGTSKIQTFTFVISPNHPSTIVMHSRNLAPVLEPILPNGRFEVTLVPK